MKSAFYNKLEQLYKTTPKYDVKIVLGDFNVQMGKDKLYAPNLGQHSLHEENNDNGDRAVVFAVSNQLAISSK